METEPIKPMVPFDSILFALVPPIHPSSSLNGGSFCLKYKSTRKNIFKFFQIRCYSNFNFSPFLSLEIVKPKQYYFQIWHERNSRPDIMREDKKLHIKIIRKYFDTVHKTNDILILYKMDTVCELQLTFLEVRVNN